MCDERFQSLFNEGAKTTHDFRAAYNREAEEKAEEAEESEQEDRIGDVEYPDTPLSSDEEWDEWMNKKKKQEVKPNSMES